MRRIEVNPGDDYGGLVVLVEVPSRDRRRVLCLCTCGSKVEVRLDHLRAGQETCGRCGLEHGGQRKTVVQWAKEAGIPESTLRARLKMMGLGEALERGRVR